MKHSWITKRVEVRMTQTHADVELSADAQVAGVCWGWDIATVFVLSDPAAPQRTWRFRTLPLRVEQPLRLPEDHGAELTLHSAFSNTDLQSPWCLVSEILPPPAAVKAA